MMKEYLDDAVYADYDGWNLVLTTSDGYRDTNTIVLEPAVLDALMGYVERLRNPEADKAGLVSMDEAVEMMDIHGEPWTPPA